MPLAGVRAEWALAGRDDELALLMDWLRGPEPRPVVISGAAGVGKSRLAAEACIAVGSDFTVEWCEATRSAASIPFGPVAHLLAPDTGTGRLDDALRGALLAIGQRPGMTLVAIDDVHLLDDASATLVHRLATDGTAQLLLTRRSGESTPDPITAMLHDDATRYLELQPLSRDETGQLLANVLGDPVETQTVDRLWSLTGGNLLFLRELVRTLRDEHTLTTARGLWRWRGAVSTAPRLFDVLHARLDRLDADERDALTILAFAEPLPLSILRELVDGNALASLGRQGLVVVEASGPASTARLAHPLYAELLRVELSPLEEMEASRRVAEAAVRVADATVSHARWVSAWALEAGVELPSDLILDATSEALQAADPERAERLARAALARSPSAEASLLLGESLLARDRFQEADDVLAAAWELADDDATRARIVRLRVVALQEGLGRGDEAARVLDDAIDAIQDPVYRGFVAAQRALELAHTGNFREAAELALPLLDSPDEVVRLRAVSPASIVLVVAGHPRRALAATRAALEPALRIRDRLPGAPEWVVSSHVTTLIAAGELDEASRFLDMVETHRDGEFSPFVALGRGRIALLQGRPATAARHLLDAVSGLDDGDPSSRKVWALSLLAEACAFLGDADGAARASREATESARPLVHHFDGDSDRARAWAHVAAARVTKARDVLHGVADQYRDDAPLFELLALHDVVRLGDAVGVVDRIEALVPRVDVRYAPAFLAHTRGLSSEDAAVLDAASEMFEAIGCELLAAEAAAEATAIWRRRGERGRASLSSARATQLVARCEGAKTPALVHLDDEPGARLTPREREIAALAAQGLTSSAISDELVVSVRTIDNHLQRVYTKLGINSRTELAARLGAADREVE
jgi:ATP/maltotriose-dependent transcriptional regulator MalT